MALLGHEGHQNHLECIIVTHLRWHDRTVLPTGHVGVVEDYYLDNDVASIVRLCSERRVRLEDGLRQTVQESVKHIGDENALIPGTPRVLSQARLLNKNGAQDYHDSNN